MWKLVAIPFFAVCSLQAADFEGCPAKLDVQTQQLTRTPAGWTAGQTADARHDLWFVTMYDGPPKEKASLVPDISGRLKQGWTLEGSGRPHWLECHYTQTTIVLARPVPGNAKVCEVTFAPSVTLDGQPVIKQIVCR
jgi:hypothetical protein